MSLFTPIFDRRGVLVAWLLDNAFAMDLDAKSLASVHPDGSVYSQEPATSPVISNYVGSFVDGYFRDMDGFPVAFVDRTLESDSPKKDGMFSPLMAQQVANWSPMTWEEFVRPRNSSDGRFDL